MAAVPGGYVPVRLDAPTLLGAASGRREAHHLSALSVAVALAEDADWRTNTLDPFRSVAWAGEHHMAWRRLRRALDHLAGVGVARAELRPFQPGTATLTGGRSHRACSMTGRGPTSASCHSPEVLSGRSPQSTD